MRQSIILGVSIILLVGTAGSVGAGNGFDISTDNDVPVPTRTISPSGQTFNITAIAQAEMNESLTVTVTAPSNAFTNLYLYNSNQAIVASDNGDGTNTYKFKIDESAGFTPGTYAFIAQHNFTRQAILPLVIEQYDIAVSAPKTAEVGSDVTIRTETGIEDSVNTAEVIFADERSIRTAATTVSSTGRHSGVIDTTGLSSGEYQAYVIIRGNETVLGQQEILSIGGPTTIQLTHDGDEINTETATMMTTEDGTDNIMNSNTEQSSEDPEMSSEGPTQTATAASETGPQVIAAVLCLIAVIAWVRNR